MYFYACPLCWPEKRAGTLIKAKSEDIPCDHKQGFFNKDKECKEDNYKCKEVMECVACKEQFKISEEFLREQRKKDKDG